MVCLDHVPHHEIWAVDFEFRSVPGEVPTPHCMVARELRTGRTIKLFGDELRRRKTAPFDVGPNTVVVAYFASAEMSCFLSLGWGLPVNLLDLYVEFRNLTNGIRLPDGNGLLNALVHFGLPHVNGVEKEEMRQLAIRGDPFTDQEVVDLLNYCETDVVAVGGLFPHLVKGDRPALERALVRGRFMKAVAMMESIGVPIDMEMLTHLRRLWPEIKTHLVKRIDADYGIYEGTTFKQDRFAKWLTRNGIAWPLDEIGKLKLDDETFRAMAKMEPRVNSLRELRHALSGMRLEDLSVGQDGRNRTLLSPFRARTGRNQPSNTHFIFGPSVWLRGLIKPSPGRGLAYIDWEQQEFGIAAALSGDGAMKQAYESGDPYLAFAQQAGAAPSNATKHSHKEVRDKFKACALGVQYGMGETTLAYQLGQPAVMARDLLALHHRTYPVYWRWSQGAITYAMLHGQLWTTFGWEIRVGPQTKPVSLGNFPMQANGAEMLRLACSFATELGVRVCAPVHDAVLIEAPLERLEADIETMKRCMANASRIVLDGFTLRTEVSTVKPPDRYADKRGARMWSEVTNLLGEIDGEGATG